MEEKILNIVRMKGPVLPHQIAKEIGSNILMASAQLSELTDRKLLKLSHIKVGGSPVYYVPGQEHKLQNYSNKLHPKEQEVYILLRQNRILRDKEQTPLFRVALKNMQDFAIPLDVRSNGEIETFWK